MFSLLMNVVFMFSVIFLYLIIFIIYVFMCVCMNIHIVFPELLFISLQTNTTQYKLQKILPFDNENTINAPCNVCLNEKPLAKIRIFVYYTRNTQHF